MKNSVFISRDAEEVGDLIAALHSAGYDVICQSLIATEAVGFSAKLPDTDWIFFSSANAVRHFFSQNPEVHNQKLGAIGESTAAELAKHGPVAFTGNGADIAGSAKQFAQVAGDQTVLFAGAEGSLRSIQSALATSQVHELVCYRTKEKPLAVKHCEILVFSSPSNVRAYCRMNGISKDQACIAYGPSTASAIQDFGGPAAILPDSLNIEGLLNAIKKAAVS